VQLKSRAENHSEDNRAAVRARAVSAQAKATADHATAKALEKKARRAEARAQELLTKTKCAEDKRQRKASSEMDLPIEECQEIVLAFTDCLTTLPLIGDSSLLPYPKSVILYALGEMLNYYEHHQEATDDPTVRKMCEDIIPKTQYLVNTLLYLWHDIDVEDKHAIAALNRLDSFPTWGLPLKEKYLSHDEAAKEAADAAIDRTIRSVAAGRRPWGQSLNSE
jgi:hypothetical protein